MNQDVFERLAVDRSLGALSPDVEELFDAYAKLDPQSSRSFAQTSSTVELARRAMAERVPSSMPAFPIAGMMQIERWRRRLQRVAYVAGMAACLAIGASLGRLSAPATSLTQPVPPRTYVSLPQPKMVVPEQNGGGFWSIERIREQHEAAKSRGIDRPSVGTLDDWQRLLQRLDMQG